MTPLKRCHRKPTSGSGASCFGPFRVGACRTSVSSFAAATARTPSSGSSIAWSALAELRPLEFEHILEYLGNSGVEEKARENLAAMLMSKRDNLLEIAKMVDTYLAFKKKMDRARG